MRLSAAAKSAGTADQSAASAACGCHLVERASGRERERTEALWLCRTERQGGPLLLLTLAFHQTERGPECGDARRVRGLLVLSCLCWIKPCQRAGTCIIVVESGAPTQIRSNNEVPSNSRAHPSYDGWGSAVCLFTTLPIQYGRRRHAGVGVAPPPSTLAKERGRERERWREGKKEGREGRKQKRELALSLRGRRPGPPLAHVRLQRRIPIGALGPLGSEHKNLWDRLAGLLAVGL